MKKLNFIACLLLTITTSTRLYTSDCSNTEIDYYDYKKGVIAFEDLDRVIAAACRSTKKELNAYNNHKINISMFESPTNLSLNNLEKALQVSSESHFKLPPAVEVKDTAKTLIAPKINGVLKLHRPEDCPGWQKDSEKDGLPNREECYKKIWETLPQKKPYSRFSRLSQN